MRAGFFLLSILLAAQDPPARENVDFVRDVRPILNASCFKCHGPEGKPKGQLRLDLKTAAFAGGVTGPVIVPGRSAESLLYRLLVSPDAEERMPRKAPPLSKEQIEIVRRWIDEGADWPDSAAGGAKLERHWAYVKPARPPLPGARVPNFIDAFVLARLEKEGLRPSPEASKETLIRRVSLDLTGLPPSLEEIDAFAADASSSAYERLVDRLLASPHYGERWARPWLDLARYADTNGFNFDNRRSMWMWRDWVIRALNDDMPFDRFTIEQIAGDLLPGATHDQKVATGFHRNTMTNEEGGVDKEEARWETLVDRVNTTATVWLGTTFACAQCHNHKYDPISQRDFYRLLAFFETSEEPALETPTPQQEARRKALRDEIAKLQKEAGKPAKDRVAQLQKEIKALDIPSTLVMRERTSSEPPSTFVRIRGSFDRKAEKVIAGVPASLHPMRPGEPLNRLGLARWLVDRENPLVARVTVNRLWDQLFGRPLLETPEDFGSQSETPVHRELLDALAVEFMERGWSQKALLRLVVTSSTYRQSSRASPALLERDPLNRLLSRGPRFRLEAEAIRDVTLAASGLLSRKIGGPSVFPLQADASGVIAINKVETTWVPSPGEDRYRRGLYTHWRRTAPFAAFAAFDAPSRECCTVKRPRTNTPLQALSGLNDPASFDAARGLARRVIKEVPGDDRARAERAFRLCVARRPDPEELERLLAAVRADRAHFAAAPDPELSAWTMVANVLLNLDETLTKE
jgi:hypothetical protein